MTSAARVLMFRSSLILTTALAIPTNVNGGYPFDFDGDGFVDCSDYLHLTSCLSGPGVPAKDDCSNSDLDSDNDTDLDDFARIQRAAGLDDLVATLEDFGDIVTKVDLGFNDFGGNIGAINSSLDFEVGTISLDCTPSCLLSLAWDFSVDPELDAFTGWFAALFGVTDTQGTFDGHGTVEAIDFLEHYLDLDNIDGALNEQGGPRRFETLWFELSNPGTESVTLRLELKDVSSGVRFTRRVIPPGVSEFRVGWDFRNPSDYFTVPSRPNLDIHTSKEVAIIVERRNVADNIENPTRGALHVHRVWWVLDRPEQIPEGDEQLLDLLARRLYQYFLDWSSRKPASMDCAQDRSTFADLLSVGGIGFAIPAHVVAAEREWIARADAARRIVHVLRLLDDPSLFGPEQVGRIGFRGFFYHFLGVDGRRKLNFDFSESPVDESLNTVEVSWIDTSLAVMGVLVAQSYFIEDDPIENEIRSRAQSIYDRADWPFMLEPNLGQFYLSWKPNEQRTGPPYEIPDAAGLGSYSGTKKNAEVFPATLDFYTDEALIGILLAVGSETHPVPPSVYCELIRSPDAHDLIRTFPGALFTYQFLSVFLDPTALVASCPDEEPIDYKQNSTLAIQRAIEYAELNPDGFATYGPDAWGISAAEGPADTYHAYGAPPVAVNSQPEQDGTVTYYGMLSAASFTNDLRDRVLRAVRTAIRRGHWHPRFGLPDAFHDDISQANLAIDPGLDNVVLRATGPWVQRSLFAIDQGPALLHIENSRTGLIWKLLAQNPNIQRALTTLASPPAAPAQIKLEGEHGEGPGVLMFRSEASGGRTALLHDGESLALRFMLPASAKYEVRIRTSNDNFGPLEVIDVLIDDILLGKFQPPDTGGGGFGWNVFITSTLGQLELVPGGHEIRLSVAGGDGYGVEIDVVTLERIDP